MTGYRDRYRHGMYSVDEGVQRAYEANLDKLVQIVRYSLNRTIGTPPSDSETSPLRRSIRPA